MDNSASTVKISLPWKWRPLKRRMLPGCELFVDGDCAMQLARKLIPLENADMDKDTDNHSERQTFPCSAIGCTQTFTSLLSYENHYNSIHRHCCLTCHRAFPSCFILDVHIQENHDPLFSVLASRQDVYRCLVENCGDKFPNPDIRRQHMIRTHSYPASFRFHRVRSDKASNRKKPQPPATKANMDVDKPTAVATETNDTPSSPRQRPGAYPHPHPSLTPPPAPPHRPLSGSSSDKENATAASSRDTVEGDGKGEEGEEGMEVVAGGSSEGDSAPRRVFVHRVPQNFTFGHGVGRGFQRPPISKKKKKKKGAHWHQRAAEGAGETTTNIENVDMTDMADALSEAS